VCVYETPYHFLGRCCARMMGRYTVFGAYLIELDELHNDMKPVCKNLKEIFVTFGYIQRCIGPLWIGLSAGWLGSPTSKIKVTLKPKVKVKVSTK